MKVVDREKNIAYLDDYSYVIYVSTKKQYELRLHNGVSSTLIGWGSLDRCILTAKKVARYPHYFKNLYRV